VSGPSSTTSTTTHKQSKRGSTIARDEAAAGADGSLSGSSPMRRSRSLMQHGMGHGVTGVTAANKPGFVDRSARVFGVDHSARERRLQSSADSSRPFKAFVQYPTVSSRMSSKAKTSSSPESSTSSSSSSSSDESSSSKKASKKASSSSSSEKEKKSSKKSGKGK